MRSNDPLFTSHEDSFGYGCEQKPPSNYPPLQHPSSGYNPELPHTGNALSRSSTSISTVEQSGQGNIRQPQRDHSNTTHRQYDVSPPRCAAELPRLGLRHYDHRDVSPVRYEIPQHLSQSHVRGYGKGVTYHDHLNSRRDMDRQETLPLGASLHRGTPSDGRQSRPGENDLVVRQNVAHKETCQRGRLLKRFR